jgi:hypothetical protein
MTRYLLDLTFDFIMTPQALEYLIRKTVVYLEFHSDDSAKELAAQWQQVLDRIQRLKQR